MDRDCFEREEAVKPGLVQRLVLRALGVGKTYWNDGSLGTLKGIKTHGRIGCVTPATVVAHYGLISGVKP